MHSWVLFLLWLHPFILSGVISPLISSSMLDTSPNMICKLLISKWKMLKSLVSREIQIKPTWDSISHTLCCCCSDTQSCLTLWLYGLQHARLPCPSPSPGLCSNLCPLSRWCHSTISSSVTPFSSCLQSFPASGSFPVSWILPSGGQSTGVSASSSVLPMNIQDWFFFRIDWLDLLVSKGLSRVFSSTTVWKHQFFSVQPSLWSNSHNHTWLLEKS